MKIADIINKQPVSKLRKTAGAVGVTHYNMKRKAELVEELTNYFYENEVEHITALAKSLVGTDTRTHNRNVAYGVGADSTTHKTWTHGEMTIRTGNWTLIAVSKNNIITSVIIQLCGEEVKREEG